MKPQNKLAETTTPDGGRLALFEHDGSYHIRLNGQGLMHSTQSASELLLGELAASRLAGTGRAQQPPPRLLIGGLGLGFTLKSVLEKLDAQPAARIEVAELFPEVVEWNREFLRDLNGALLEDPRVEVRAQDVWELLAQAGQGAYDAIMLDVDNGPAAMVHKQNARLYTTKGVRRLAGALKAGGRACIWSAGSEERAFTERLKKAGLQVEVVPARLYPQAKRCACTIYVADKAPDGGKA